MPKFIVYISVLIFCVLTLNPALAEEAIKSGDKATIDAKSEALAKVTFQSFDSAQAARQWYDVVRER